MDSCHGNPSPSDPMESVCRYFRPPPQLYFAEYVLSLLRTDMRRSDGFLPRQPVSIGSDGVRLPTFSTPSSAIPCRIFTKSLANCLPVSLVAHGLLPSDSVRVYWTTLIEANDGPLFFATIFVNQMIVIASSKPAVLCCCFCLVRDSKSPGVGGISFGHKTSDTR